MRRAKDATALCGLICPVDSSSLCKAAVEAEAAVRMPVGISALSKAFTYSSSLPDLGGGEEGKAARLLGRLWRPGGLQVSLTMGDVVEQVSRFWGSTLKCASRRCLLVRLKPCARS